MKEKLPVQRKRKYNLREIADAIFWILRTGSQWRNLPGGFPKWNLVYYYFSKWKRDGTLTGLNTHLNMLGRELEGRKPTPSAVSIDSQSIKKAPFVGEDTGIDGNKKINGRKRHLLTDTLGLVWAAVVTNYHFFGLHMRHAGTHCWQGWASFSLTCCWSVFLRKSCCSGIGLTNRRNAFPIPIYPYPTGFREDLQSWNIADAVNPCSVNPQYRPMYREVLNCGRFLPLYFLTGFSEATRYSVWNRSRTLSISLWHVWIVSL